MTEEDDISLMNEMIDPTAKKHRRKFSKKSKKIFHFNDIDTIVFTKHGKCHTHILVKEDDILDEKSFELTKKVKPSCLHYDRKLKKHSYEYEISNKKFKYFDKQKKVDFSLLYNRLNKTIRYYGPEKWKCYEHGKHCPTCYPIYSRNGKKGIKRLTKYL